MAQGRLPQRRSARLGPALLKLLKQPSGELSGSIVINTVDSTTGKSILIPANPGTLHLELTWKGEYPLMMSLTGPAGHNLPGRVGIVAHDGTSPLRLEHHLSAADAAKGPLQLDLTLAMVSRLQGVRSIKLEDAKLVATIFPDAPTTETSNHPAQSENSAKIKESVTEGRLLTKTEADALQSKLASRPDDVLTRLSLLAFYSSRARQLPNQQEVIRQRRSQLLWMIEHQGSSPDIFSLPETAPVASDDILYDPQGTAEAKQLWTKQIDANPNDIPLLKNAARFLMRSDFLGAKAFLIEGHRIRPGDEEWTTMLAQLYSIAIRGADRPGETSSLKGFSGQAESELRSSSDPELLSSAATRLAMPKDLFKTNGTLQLKPSPTLALAEELANKAVALEPAQPAWTAALITVLQIERTTTADSSQRIAASNKMYEQLKTMLETHPSRIFPASLYSTLGVLAFDLDELENAARYSEQTLALAGSTEFTDDLSRGEAQHDANSTLGRIALKKKDVASAKKFLAEAGAASSVGIFDWHGPDMSLAQKLLELGERQAVLEYLSACENLWPTGSPLLKQWRNDIEKGKIPQLNQVR
jgi:hypothetical protein